MNASRKPSVSFTHVISWINSKEIILLWLDNQLLSEMEENQRETEARNNFFYDPLKQ